ncbi:hypothetical protein BDV96DRAFT_562887 [Lophiotrema nucula]|uniref:DUF4470 domain-containing protein n=1 Tax=Lophiotrema nucula TaxID=690887 RepID=A0A6A5ZQX7_9PLEO|nr:hypothetical protein BDV96DRAFT_562887 [Lophiotrema nucula]
MAKIYTPRWIKEKRTPQFWAAPTPSNPFNLAGHGSKQYLWGNVPALDILNLKDNEGITSIGDINLLFAASGDLRNVVKTVATVPEDYSGGSVVVVNDFNFAIVARNVILLLIAMVFDPDDATPLMIHLWYSATISSLMLKMIRESILPYIEDVCVKIQYKPDSVAQAKTFRINDRSLRVVLRKLEWFALKKALGVPDGLNLEEAKSIRRRTTMASTRKDFVDRALYCQPPAMRTGVVRFREDGTLLPYGVSHALFDTPNP